MFEGQFSYVKGLVILYVLGFIFLRLWVSNFFRLGVTFLTFNI